MAAGGPPASRFVIAAGSQRAWIWWCGLRQASGDDGGAAVSVLGKEEEAEAEEEEGGGVLLWLEEAANVHAFCNT